MVQIKSKKLFSYLNPFEDLLPGQQQLFNKAAINNFLIRSDIYHVDGDDEFDNNYRKIAYLISHPQELFVKLNIPTNQDKLKDMLIDEKDNIFSFIALSYLNPEFVTADIQGDKGFAKTFFSISSKEDFSFSQEALTVNNQVKDVNWVVEEHLLLESWRDKDFILKNINYSNIFTNYKLVPEEFWNDPTFFSGVLHKYNQHKSETNPIFIFMLRNHKYNPLFLDYILDGLGSFRMFKEHYYQDFKEYKKGNVIHPNQAILESRITTNPILMKWIREFYSKEVIDTCFPLHMIENESFLLDWYKSNLSTSDSDFNPFFKDIYSTPTLKPFILKQSQEWKNNLFEKLAEIFIENSRKGSKDKTFSKGFSQLIFNENFDSHTFFESIKDKYSLLQETYIRTFFEYFVSLKNKPVLSDDLSELVISHYPRFFSHVDKKYRTLERMTQLLPFNIQISEEEIKNFNNKDFNLNLLSNGYEEKLLVSFPPAHFLDKDYLSLLIKNKSYSVKQNKSFIRFIEKDSDLLKECINIGWHKMLSPKVFQDTEMSEHLVGQVFSKSKHDYDSFNTSEVMSVVNPVVFSNMKSLKNILTISNGNFLKQVPHLFKNKEFTVMVFDLFDKHIINNKELLPSQVRLVLDSFNINSNYKDFFIKYDLQNNLNQKLISQKSNKPVKNKI